MGLAYVSPLPFEPPRSPPAKRRATALRPASTIREPAVAPLAEGVIAGALDLDLVVELEIADIVMDVDIVQLKGGDLPFGGSCGPADLAHGRSLVEKRFTHPGERPAQAGQGLGVVFDPRVERGHGSVDEIGPGLLQAIVGAGVSAGATNGNPLANWTGLLQHGLERCQAVCSVEDDWLRKKKRPARLRRHGRTAARG